MRADKVRLDIAKKISLAQLHELRFPAAGF